MIVLGITDILLDFL